MTTAATTTATTTTATTTAQQLQTRPDQASQRHILIGGGSGFIGSELTQALRARGDKVTLISRTPGVDRLTWGDVRANGIPDCDLVINLAGKHILDMRRRWTSSYREEVIRSRIDTTKALVEAINNSANPPSTFISTAGKCFYGSQAYQRSEEYFDLDEHSEPVGIDFPAELVSRWEAAADGIDSDKVRHVKLRFGIVLASDVRGSDRQGSDEGSETQRRSLGARGIFPMLHSVFKRGLCFGMGSGVQPFPWIHINDVVGIVLRAIDRDDMHGIFNAVAPGIVSNTAFTALLAGKLNRWVLGRIPAWLIKGVVGKERSTILLLGQRVKPNRTLEYGYRFQFPDLSECLDDLLSEQQTPSLQKMEYSA